MIAFEKQWKIWALFRRSRSQPVGLDEEEVRVWTMLVEGAAAKKGSSASVDTFLNLLPDWEGNAQSPCPICGRGDLLLPVVRGSIDNALRCEDCARTYEQGLDALLRAKGKGRR